MSGGEAVASDLPCALDLLQNKQLLVRLSRGPSGGVDQNGPLGVRPSKRPLRREHALAVATETRLLEG